MWQFTYQVNWWIWRMLGNMELSINAAVHFHCYNFRMVYSLCNLSFWGWGSSNSKKMLIRSALYCKNRIDKFRKEFSSLSLQWVEIILQDDHSVKEMPGENILKMLFGQYEYKSSQFVDELLQWGLLIFISLLTNAYIGLGWFRNFHFFFESVVLWKQAFLCLHQ